MLSWHCWTTCAKPKKRLRNCRNLKVTILQTLPWLESFDEGPSITRNVSIFYCKLRQIPNALLSVFQLDISSVCSRQWPLSLLRPFNGWNFVFCSLLCHCVRFLSFVLLFLGVLCTVYRSLRWWTSATERKSLLNTKNKTCNGTSVA